MSQKLCKIETNRLYLNVFALSGFSPLRDWKIILAQVRGLHNIQKTVKAFSFLSPVHVVIEARTNLYQINVFIRYMREYLRVLSSCYYIFMSVFSFSCSAQNLFATCSNINPKDIYLYRFIRTTNPRVAENSREKEPEHFQTDF